MPDPLADNIVAMLKTDKCAALAAIMIVANAHSELLAWAQRTIVPPAAKANGVGHDKPRKVAKLNGGKGAHSPREGAAEHDQALLALMQANPGASVTKIIAMNDRPRNSTVLSLDRLERAGLVEHAGRGKWVAVDPDLLEAPTPKPADWVAPLSGARVAQHTAAMRVPDRLTTA